MRTIDITTTQNVTIEYELATVRERGLAMFIDIIVVLTIVSVLSIGLSSGLFFLSFAPLFMIYQLVSEILGDGQSMGKKALGIRVVRLDGEHPGLSDYLFRAIFHFVDSFLSIFSIALILISSSAKSQRLGDMAANTTVIRVLFNSRFYLEDILKINTIDDYEPMYPEVKKMSEQDMLLIKNIISRYRQYPNEAHQKVVQDLVNHVMKILDLKIMPDNKIEFLKTLIRDYIVLTR